MVPVIVTGTPFSGEAVDEMPGFWRVGKSPKTPACLLLRSPVAQAGRLTSAARPPVRDIGA